MNANAIEQLRCRSEFLGSKAKLTPEANPPEELKRERWAAERSAPFVREGGRRPPSLWRLAFCLSLVCMHLSYGYKSRNLTPIVPSTDQLFPKYIQIKKIHVYVEHVQGRHLLRRQKTCKDANALQRAGLGKASRLRYLFALVHVSISNICN